MKQRVQHPKVHERKDRGTYYWFFRYRHDEVLQDGKIKTTRKFHTIGPSRPNAVLLRRAGELELEAQAEPEGAARRALLDQAASLREQGRAISKREADHERDKFLAGLNAAPTRCEAAVQAKEPPEVGAILFGKLAELWRSDFVEREVGGKPLIAATTRAKYINHLNNHILPRWKNTRLAEFRSKDLMDWLQTEAESWHMMADLRNIMSGIFTKAHEWEILPESFANPMKRVKLPKKWDVREKRILTEDETVRVLARLSDPALLVNETCVTTGTRISEVLGLKLKHLDLTAGTIRIEQRNWRGDIDVPKSEKSRRLLALGNLADRYRAWITRKNITDPEAWLFPRDNDRNQPMWDSGVRIALKKAAAAEGCDFEGLGPHSLRRANITWRQEVGGSSIEASRIAGHANTKITEEYTFVQLKRQQELTRRIQDKLEKAGKKLKEKDEKVIDIRARGAA